MQDGKPIVLTGKRKFARNTLRLLARAIGSLQRAVLATQVLQRYPPIAIGKMKQSEMRPEALEGRKSHSRGPRYPKARSDGVCPEIDIGSEKESCRYLIEVSMDEQTRKRDHPPVIDHTTGTETIPVLAITLTSRPTERRIYGQLLMAMGANVHERLTLMELEIRTVLKLKSHNVRVLVFDEVHNLLAGTPREQRVILQLLRYLRNEIKASLVSLGVSEARDAIAGDTQLARRLDQFVLPRWKADEEFQEFVTAIPRSLPLKLPSVISSQSLRHLSRLTASCMSAFNSIKRQLRRPG